MHNVKFEKSLARSLVNQFGWNTMAYQILNPGISLWFPEKKDAVVGYVQTRTHVIVAGSPVAEEEALDEVVLEFYRFVSSMKKKVCFFGAQERIAAILQKRSPVSSILLGAQPVWEPEEFLAVMHSKESLRAQVHRAENKNLSTEVWNKNESKEELYLCLSQWISTRPLPPMHFLVEPDTLGNLDDRILVAARNGGTIVGFCIASPIPLRNGWLIEQIVRGTDAPNGTAELLLETMVSHLQSLQAELITLGLSPLSQHYHPHTEQSLWLKNLLRIVRLYGRSFYNFDGLDSFKSKFVPSRWEPVFAITNEKGPSLLTLYAIAAAFAGMSPVKFLTKGIVRMIVS